MPTGIPPGSYVNKYYALNISRVRPGNAIAAEGKEEVTHAKTAFLIRLKETATLF
jgi:hypothetical protein